MPSRSTRSVAKKTKKPSSVRLKKTNLRAVKSSGQAKSAATGSAWSVNEADVAKRLGKIAGAYTKSQIIQTLCEECQLTRRQAQNAMECFTGIMRAHLRRGSCQEFKWPGLMKVSVKHKPATKARKGINPFTGEETMFKAKPAQYAVKIRPLQLMKSFTEK